MRYPKAEALAGESRFIGQEGYYRQLRDKRTPLQDGCIMAQALLAIIYLTRESARISKPSLGEWLAFLNWKWSCRIPCKRKLVITVSTERIWT